MPDRLRHALSFVAGAGFILAAVITLQYQEVWAPRLEGMVGAAANLGAGFAQTVDKARSALASF